MRIDFEIIQHRHQRYPTVGDWLYRRHIWWFRASWFRDKRYSWLIFFHEFIEWGICQLQGIKQKDIDKFDMTYEKARESETQSPPCGCNKFEEEPGNDIHAPYREAHQVATQCEQIIAKALNVDWKDYNAAVERL